MRFILVVLSLYTVCCGKPANRHENAILVFGDSIAAGYAASYFYAQMLGDELRMPVNNFAIPGSRIDQKGQYPTIMQTEILPGDIVLFCPGINDAAQNALNHEYLKNYEKQLRDIVSKFYYSGARVYLGTTLMGVHRDELNAYAEKYAQIMRDVSKEYEGSNIVLVDTRVLFKPTPELLPDDIHPNVAGHRVLADIYIKFMRN